MVLGQLQRARRKVIARIRDYKAILGDATGQVYADPGFYWVRPLGQADDNGNSTPGVPYQVRSGVALVVPRGGRQVWVGIGLDGHLTVKGFVHEDLASTDVGIDPRSLQPNDPYRAWIKLKQIQNFRALPLATGTTASMKVQVRQLFYYTETGDLVRYNGTNSSTHIDLTGYVPAADLQRYVVLWLRVYNPNALSDIQVTQSSTISSLDDSLSFDELQECADLSDADTIPIQAFRLHDAQTTLAMDDTIDVDLRQFINMPQIYGFPNSVARHYRIHAAHSVIMPEVVTIASGGGMDIQNDGVLVILDTDPASGGSAADTALTAPFVDTTAIVKGSADATKQARFEVDGFTTATTRAFTLPNADTTLVGTDIAQTLTNKTLTSPKIAEIRDADGNTGLTISNIDSPTPPTVYLGVLTDSIGSLYLTAVGVSNTDLILTAQGTGQIALQGRVIVSSQFLVDTVGYASHPAPDMTTAQRNGLSPNAGDEIENTTTGTRQRYNGSTWDDIVTSAIVANRALSNLASVAINTTLVSDTDDTDDLGTSSVKWREIFTGRLNVTSTTKASIPAPVMTTAQFDAATLVEGATGFSSDQNEPLFYDGATRRHLYHPLYSFLLHPFSEHTIVSGAAMSWTSDVNQVNGGYIRRTAAAVNDEVAYSVALPAGTYHIEYMALKNTNCGIMTLKFDGSTISTHDLYAAAMSYNVRGSSSNFNVNIAGVYTFTNLVASKNASSSNYFTLLSWFQFIRTANYP